MPEKNYLAFDLGAESGRTIAGTLHDDTLTLTEIHRFQNTPIQTPSGLHWDVPALWQEIKNSLRLAAKAVPLESIGLDAWGVDFALLDKEGNLLGNPYHYRDTRTDGMLEQAFQRIPRQEIFAQTGIQFMQINTLYQLLSMVIARDPLLESARTFLTIPDLFNYWLSGKITCEFTNATTTQCLNPTSRTWAKSLLERMKIPSHIFPAICEPGALLGTLLLSVAADTGADSIPVIAPACHDTGSAVAAIPATNQDFAWISSGTWSILGAEVHEPALGPKALAYNFTNEGGVFGTWRLSKNIMGLWIVQECRRSWEGQGKELTYSDLTQLAAEARPFLAVIDPDADLFFRPGEMVEKVRAYCAGSGLAVPQTEGETVRVVLESLALKYRLILSRLEELSGKRLDPIHIIGGGSRNRLLNQFTADCTGRTVVAGPVEATAIGNILMQAITLSQLDSLADARLLVRNSFDVETFLPGDPAGWDESYGKLLEMVEGK